MLDDVNASLNRAGLDPKPPPGPMKYPRLVDENADQLWLRCFIDGTDRECEVTIGQAWAMAATLFHWLEKASKR